ncbi:MAG: hypothetical protein WCJ29_00215 [bacterium]
MKRVTAIERKINRKELLTKDELIFLYEIEAPIQGFGRGNDPRVAKIRETRNLKEDALIVLDCRLDQIATSEKEIRPDIKAYIGPLFPGIFKLHIENIFTRFPDQKVIKEKVEVDYGQSLEQMIAAGKYDWKNGDINEKNFPRKRSAKTALKNIFGKEKEKTEIEVIAVAFGETLTTKQIEDRLDALGLRPATLEELLALGAAKPDLQRKSWIVALGSDFVDSDGGRGVPCLNENSGRRELGLSWGFPGSQWGPDNRFLAVRK